MTDKLPVYEENPHSMQALMQRMMAGESSESLEAEIEEVGLQRVEEDDSKCWDECDCCGQTTVLVKEVMLCGPCCFGEAETYNGNW